MNAIRSTGGMLSFSQSTPATTLLPKYSCAQSVQLPIAAFHWA